MKKNPRVQNFSSPVGKNKNNKKSLKIYSAEMIKKKINLLTMIWLSFILITKP